MRNKAKRGFTLVEILIVVVILGILAAIVIPQFSDASTQSKVSSSLSTLQSLRSQIQLYKIQHNDTPPALASSAYVDQMTSFTDSDATVYATKAAAITAANESFGPYMQAIPANPWNQEITWAATAAAGNGWVYDETNANIFLDVTDVTDATVKAKLVADGVGLSAN